MATLFECCIVVVGQSPPGDTYNVLRSGLPFYQGKAEFGDLYPTPTKWCSQPTKVAASGDVLISVRAPVGPTNLAFENCCIGRGLAALRPRNGIRTKFVLYQLRHSKRALVGVATGSTFSAVSSQQLREHKFVLAPLPEQDRIVAEIEKQFSRLEAATAALRRAQANLKRYRASLLKAACEGRLVPTEAALARQEGRSYEPAAQLIERILAERRARWAAEHGSKKPYKEPAAPDTANLPPLPEGWAWTTVDQLASRIQYGSSAKCSADGGVPVLRMGNISTDGSISTAAGIKYLDESHSEFPDLLLEPGDLLFNRTNSAELVGKSAVYDGIPSPCSFASYLIRASFSPGVDSRYMCGCLNSVLGRGWIKNVVNQQVGQANVNGTKLRGFCVPFPPFLEQRRITGAVAHALDCAAAANAALVALEKRQQALCQSILRQAFSGKLVPQDAADEPAAVLLERIRAARAAEVPDQTRNRAVRPAQRAKAAAASGAT
jgi:type I restriction enzyme S subunit